jgi:hypothetical protein
MTRKVKARASALLQGWKRCAGDPLARSLQHACRPVVCAAHHGCCVTCLPASSARQPWHRAAGASLPGDAKQQQRSSRSRLSRLWRPPPCPRARATGAARSSGTRPRCPSAPPATAGVSVWLACKEQTSSFGDCLTAGAPACQVSRPRLRAPHRERRLEPRHQRAMPQGVRAPRPRGGRPHPCAMMDGTPRRCFVKKCTALLLSITPPRPTSPSPAQLTR